MTKMQTGLHVKYQLFLSGL